MKKSIYLITAIIFLLSIFVANVSLASYSTVTMTVVEEPVATIDIGEHSKFEKKLISKDLNNKEVTLQLQVTNEETDFKPTGELMLVLDNSDSMNENIQLSDGSTPTRKQVIFDAAKTLVSNLLEDNDNLQIGIVSFSSAVAANPRATSREASLDDANLISGFSNDSSVLNAAIDGIVANGPRTDLDAGLQTANAQFTDTANNKYMIVLTDGVPNIAVGQPSYYSDEVIAATKSQLQSISNSGVQLITMLTGISSDLENRPTPTNPSKTYGDVISEIFGSSDNPTAGEFYYVTDENASETITTDIYNSLLPVSRSLKNITIKDYFPKEIIDNFDFAYVSQPNIGNISAEVDKSDNSITWTIPELKSGETATVQYTLKLKEDFDSNIVDKILDTNEKVDITYTDTNDQDQSDTTDVTPKLKLTEPPAELPFAGTMFMFGAGVVIAGFLVFSIIKYRKINKILK